MMGRGARQWGEGLQYGWIKKPRRMTSAWEEVRRGMLEKEAFRLHVLNHTVLLKPLIPRHRNTNSSSRLLKIQLRPRREGGKSPRVWVSAVQGSWEEKQGNWSRCRQPTRHKALSQIPACWLVERWAETPPVLSRHRLGQEVWLSLSETFTAAA